MSEGITVHYFPLYGRGELIRTILHYNGTQFTDHIIPFAEWPAFKASGDVEFGQLPMVEVDGLKLVQSGSIARYLCQKFGYYPSHPEHVYLVESLCDYKNDVFTEYVKLKLAKDEEGLEKLFNEKLPLWLAKAEARLEKNHGGAGFFVGDSITLADLTVFQLVWEYMLSETKVAKFGPIVDQHAPKLRAWAHRIIDSSASLKAYLETKPHYDL